MPSFGAVVSWVHSRSQPLTWHLGSYILARHGINPRSYAGINAPVRIGDILLLPARSFQADASEGPQPEHVCVWHGFLGSWKSKDET